MTTTIISNILNNITGNKTAYFSGNKGLLYHLIQSDTNYSIIDKPNQPFGLYITDELIIYSQNKFRTDLENHANDIILVTENAPVLLKKEDKFILSRKLSKSHKIFFDPSFIKSWDMTENSDTFSIIDYGCKIIENGKHNNDVLILNFKKNAAIDALTGHLRSSMLPNTTINILSEYNNDYDSLLQYISDHKIVISTGGEYEALSCAAAGCFVFSLGTESVKYHKLSTIVNTNNYQDLINQTINITGIYNNISDEIIKTQKTISIKYDINKFYSDMVEIYNLVSKKVFIHEA